MTSEPKQKEALVVFEKSFAQYSLPCRRPCSMWNTLFHVELGNQVSKSSGIVEEILHGRTYFQVKLYLE